MINSKKLLIGLFITLIIIRFLNLNQVPIFGDEALYLWLADELQHNLKNSFLSISYGVFPVMIWLMAIIQTLTFNFFDSLFLGRFLSVSSDIVSALIIYHIAKKIVNRKYASIASLIYLALPLNFFHSRFALLDSLTNTFSLAVILTSVKSLDWKDTKLHLKWVGLFTFFVILAFFTKPISVVNLFPAFTIPILKFLDSKKISSNQIKMYLLNYLLVGLSSVAIFTLFYYPIQNQFSNRYVSENKTFTSFVSGFKKNAWSLVWWSKSYLPQPILMVVFLTSIFSLFKRQSKIIWLSTWLISILILECALSAHFFPRHLLPLSAPISLLIGYFIYLIYNKNLLLSFIMILIILTPSLVQVSQILINTRQANIALEDKQQLYEDWTSGAGFKETSEYLKNLSPDSDKIIVFFENDSALIWTFNKHLKSENYLNIKPSSSLTKDEFLTKDELQEIPLGQTAYILLNRFSGDHNKWPVTKIFSAPKGINRTIDLYRINAP